MNWKIGLLLLIAGCSILARKNYETLRIGMSEQEFVQDYKPLQSKQFGDHKIMSFGEGLVVTNGSTILHKFPIQHEWSFTAQVGGVSVSENQKFKYFLVPDPRIVDTNSILFPMTKNQVTTMLRYFGETVVENEAESTAILKIGYAVTGYQKRTQTYNSIVMSETVEYSRIFTMTATGKEKGKTNLWEIKVDSIGSSNDLSIFLPGLIAASGQFLNTNTSGSVGVGVDGTSIAMNVIKNPDLFRPFIKQLDVPSYVLNK